MFVLLLYNELENCDLH